jgi:DNA polymerase-3 subunit alpha
MESIPSYIERKRNPERVSYLDPRMKDILIRSYGVITYQDDVLMIAIHLAGYSWGEVDTLRKAMGKKIPKEMEAQKEKLIAGAIENGMTKEKAEMLWKLIEPFAGYGFNKAHAASYGKVAYQTAYMKANFPVAYMAALLSGDAGDVDKIAIIVNECSRMGILVLPPDVNESGTDFTIVGPQSIRFGLVSIKNLGEGVSQAIIDEREKKPFLSLEDFLTRLPNEHVNKRVIESLAKCGALDSLASRERVLTSLEEVLIFGREAGAIREQDSLFGASVPPPKLILKDAVPPPLTQTLAWEKELLGMYVSGHPLDAHKELSARSKMTIKDIEEERRSGTPVLIPAVVEELKTKLTKTGEKMAFVTLSDKTGAIECVVFPRAFKSASNGLSIGSSILMRGNVSLRNGEVSLVAEELKVLAAR